ncbi:unnamed protein product [Polarella glacialis]|uniref:Uncharacterized protein n=1 Tax=Polarella glacialis TaxID=89957 RepID=A0A813DK97_POLGL|nr:unnamed protein product [Polarella glacialis]CAE8737031.1 unnamed protein product [Polarella glacialis]
MSFIRWNRSAYRSCSWLQACGSSVGCRGWNLNSVRRFGGQGSGCARGPTLEQPPGVPCDIWERYREYLDKRRAHYDSICKAPLSFNQWRFRVKVAPVQLKQADRRGGFAAGATAVKPDDTSTEDWQLYIHFVQRCLASDRKPLSVRQWCFRCKNATPAGATTIQPHSTGDKTWSDYNAYVTSKKSAGATPCSFAQWTRLQPQGMTQVCPAAVSQGTWQKYLCYVGRSEAMQKVSLSFPQWSPRCGAGMTRERPAYVTDDDWQRYSQYTVSRIPETAAKLMSVRQFLRNQEACKPAGISISRPVEVSEATWHQYMEHCSNKSRASVIPLLSCPQWLRSCKGGRPRGATPSCPADIPELRWGQYMMYVRSACCLQDSTELLSVQQWLQRSAAGLAAVAGRAPNQSRMGLLKRVLHETEYAQVTCAGAFRHNLIKYLRSESSGFHSESNARLQSYYEQASPCKGSVLYCVQRLPKKESTEIEQNPRRRLYGGSYIQSMSHLKPGSYCELGSFRRALTSRYQGFSTLYCLQNSGVVELGFLRAAEDLILSKAYELGAECLESSGIHLERLRHWDESHAFITQAGALAVQNGWAKEVVRPG